MGEFGSNYINSRPTKDRGKDPVKWKKFYRQQENIDIGNSAVDETLLQ